MLLREGPWRNIGQWKVSFQRICEFKRKHNPVRTTNSFFEDMAQFFEFESIPDCRAGERFLVVNPDGRLTPCAMFIETRYKTRKELVEKFSKHNTCDGCYISTRGNTEKTLWQLLTDNLAALRLSNRVARS